MPVAMPELGPAPVPVPVPVPALVLAVVWVAVLVPVAFCFPRARAAVGVEGGWGARGGPSPPPASASLSPLPSLPGSTAGGGGRLAAGLPASRGSGCRRGRGRPCCGGGGGRGGGGGNSYSCCLPSAMHPGSIAGQPTPLWACLPPRPGEGRSSRGCLRPAGEGARLATTATGLSRTRLAVACRGGGRGRAS